MYSQPGVIFAGVKLIKKRDHRMNSSSKNNKYYTSFRMLALLAVLTLLCGFGSDTHNKLHNTDDKWVVVIDAGHGGKDPGTHGKLSKEKDIALAIALKTGNYIESQIEGVQIIYTRKKDEFIELYKRAEIANKASADLFISIHCNGVSDRRIKGSETFAMGLHKDDGNLEVAMKENSVITMEEDYSTRYQGYDPNSSESFIAFSLMQNIYLEQSLNFASFVQSQFKDRVGLRDRGVKQAGFLVLWQTTMPSVLVETGFISNVDEEKFLKSAKGQDYVASAIFRAFRDYKAAIDQKSGFTTVKVQEKDEKEIIITNDKTIDFRVQFSSSSTKKDLNSDDFGGLSEINEIQTGKYYKYSSGSFTTYKEAATHRKIVQFKYPDAFVIAVQANKTIPLQEAIEKSKNR